MSTILHEDLGGIRHFHQPSVTISFFSYYAVQMESRRKQDVRRRDFDPSLGWKNISSIIIAVMLFGIFAYSAFTRNKVASLIQNKFLRSILILIPTGLLLYINCEAINSISILQNHTTVNLFVCDKENHYCFLYYSHIFLAVITGVFVIVEVAMSFFMSPPRPSPKSVDI
ncbi:hypothetical protein BGX24_003867 [Mortierella sp. AD032]|nr:hypothetical protein BGX24_003867 [Mortierella sp. AD032]